MEGTQPSAAGGDGAPTAMVAVPGLPGALTQAFPLLGGSGTVSMEASLRLRAKDYAAHDRWLVNLQDVITSNRLDDLWENQQVPTNCNSALALGSHTSSAIRPQTTSPASYFSRL